MAAITFYKFKANGRQTSDGRRRNRVFLNVIEFSFFFRLIGFS